MELVRQVVGVDGLQIPLPVIERYGLKPGAQVVLELGPDSIQIAPVISEQEKIEGLALRYLLSCLGDAATVKVERKDDCWHVLVYGAGLSQPVGELFYSLSGELLPDRSTSIEIMRQRST